MPELPEVETIARQLNQVLPGRVVKSVEVMREKSFKGDPKSLIGRTIKKVGRRVKMIILELQATSDKRQDLNLLIHLKMTGQLIFMEDDPPSPRLRKGTAGQLIFQPQATGDKRQADRIVGGHPTEDWINALPSKHTRVIVRFTDGSTLYFNDMRVFGWIKIMTNDQLSMINSTLPPDVVDPEYTIEYLKKVLKRSQRAVKLVLMDQTKIGGLGNIYANDALYLAHTKPTRRANSLKPAEIEHLFASSIQVIRRGIETGGASESTYKHINGLGGKYQEEFAVYKREGERCGLNGCEGVIKKIKLGGRGTYYCPDCQR